MVAHRYEPDQPTDASLPIDDRVIRAVTRAEEGWLLSVRDEHGIDVDYWIAHPGFTPLVGQVARLYGGTDGIPIQRMEIAGRRVR